MEKLSKQVERLEEAKIELDGLKLDFKVQREHLEGIIARQYARIGELQHQLTSNPVTRTAVKDLREHIKRLEERIRELTETNRSLEAKNECLRHAVRALVGVAEPSQEPVEASENALMEL